MKEDKEKGGGLERKSVCGFLPLLVLLADYLAVVSAEESAFLLRKFILHHGAALHISWLNFWIIFPAFYIAFLHIEGLYSRGLQFWQSIRSIFAACIYAVVAVIIELYVGQLAASTSRLFVLLFGVLAFLFITVFRYLLKLMLGKYSWLQLPILVIGAGRTAEILVRGIDGDAGMGYKIIGLLEDKPVTGKYLRRFPVLGGFADAEAVIKATGIRHVIIAAPGMEQEALTQLIYRVQPLVSSLRVIPNLVGVPMSGIEAESLFNEKLILLRLRNNLARPVNRYIKVIFDYLLTILGLLVIWPFLLLIAAWVYADSPGRVIFSHERIGKGGKSFKCYKFRSMCADADKKLAELLASDREAKKEWEQSYKLKNDPRITKSGAFLRRTSLDELPQILNVLKGEMSLVGPRPVVKAELEKYGSYGSDYLLVRPGITGLWQVSGRSDTTYGERVQMDSWYVRNWSVWLDIFLLWRTLKSVLRREGAY